MPLTATVSEEKKDTVPLKGQRTLKNINLLQFVKTERNFNYELPTYVYG